MRIRVTLLAAAVLLSASPALADSRIFIIANQADDYGVDQCLARGERCGAPLARAYCQQRDFTDASAYRRIEGDEITGAVPAVTGGKCSTSGCSEYVAITCRR
jgi:hypothetical protein